MPSSHPQAPSSEISVEELRAVAERAVRASSIRIIASEIGISHGGLDNFIKGVRPRASTRDKVAAWHVQNAPRGTPATATSIRASLGILLDEVPAPYRGSVMSAMAHAARNTCAEIGITAPAWTQGTTGSGGNGSPPAPRPTGGSGWS